MSEWRWIVVVLMETRRQRFQTLCVFNCLAYCAYFMVFRYSSRTKSWPFFSCLETSHNELESNVSLCVSCRDMIVGFANVPHLFYSELILHYMSAHFTVIDRLFLSFYTKNKNIKQFGWNYRYQRSRQKICRCRVALYWWLSPFQESYHHSDHRIS